MSGKVSGLVWDLDLPQNEKYVLLAYADKADHEGNNAHPGVGLVAWMTGYSEDSVRRITRDLLSKRGLLEVQERGGGGSANKFRVCLENFKTFERPPRKRRGRPTTPENPPQINPPQNNGGLFDGKTPITAIPPQRPYTTVGNYEEQSSSSESSDSQTRTVPLNKYITDRLYNALKDRGIRWSKDEYGFHLGRVNDMIAKDDPTDAEIEALPSQMLRTLAFKPDADAVHALRDLRRADLRKEAEDEQRAKRERKRRELREEMSGPAPWQEQEGESYYEKRYNKKPLPEWAEKLNRESEQLIREAQKGDKK